jgi:hypothetical protein
MLVPGVLGIEVAPVGDGDDHEGRRESGHANVFAVSMRRQVMLMGRSPPAAGPAGTLSWPRVLLVGRWFHADLDARVRR